MDINTIINFLADKQVVGISYYQIISCFALILLTFIAVKVFNIFAEETIVKFTKKTKNQVDDALIKGLKPPITWFMYISGFYWAVLMLHPTNDKLPLKDILDATVETFIAIVITWATFVVTDVLTEALREWMIAKAKESAERAGEKYEEPLLTQFLPLFKKALKVAIALVALIIVIQNRGYSVTSLVASFGITGLAIGFAAKDSIANVFGSITVMIDNVYKIGDWIIVDKTISGSCAEGVVEDITLRSTKIRAFDRTMIVIPNNEMANGTIKNVSRHDRRRIYCTLDIEYDTPPDKVRQAVEVCKKIVEEHPGMYPYKEIHFTELSSSSLKIMLYLFTKTVDWHEFMVIRQEIFLSIMEEFDKLGVRFAFPTQTLFLNSDKHLEHTMHQMPPPMMPDK